MAIQSRFDDLTKEYVKYFKLDGEVIRYDDFMNININIIFKFWCKYLSINDIKVIYGYEYPDISYIFDFTVKHLKDIKFQFEDYFNELWC